MSDKAICSALLSEGGAVRLLSFLLFWYVLAGAEPRSWVVGLPVALCAVRVSLWLRPAVPCRLRPAGLLLFIPFFLTLSLLGAFDVMRRVIDPRLPMKPGLVIYHSKLPVGPARVLLINCISLLPGTISADCTDESVTIHAIDTDLPVWATILLLESRIASIFSGTSSGEEGK
ncbi:MAG: Na+/H+ antiporter subunit E [Thermodesulfobacteriota bacterium]